MMKSKPNTGVLLVNLGSPDAPNPRAVRRYLKQFLSDPRVVAIPKFIWWFILNLFILPFRSKRTAKLYQKIWTANGSPLVHITEQQSKALQALLDEPIQVEYAMRYGNPSIKSALSKFKQNHLKKLIVLPLYPQYSQTTTASIFDEIAAIFAQWQWLPELHFINQYSDHPLYIQALANQVNGYERANGKPQKLAISFHGLPEQSLQQGDPYYCYCRKTARLLAEQLGLQDDDYTVCFQSRFGPAKWLQPYTSDVLRTWAHNGIKHIAVICPGFAADCLETLEEINIQYRALFIEEGGERFDYIPALNLETEHLNLFTQLVQPQFQSNDSMQQ